MTSFGKFWPLHFDGSFAKQIEVLPFINDYSNVYITKNIIIFAADILGVEQLIDKIKN